MIKKITFFLFFSASFAQFTTLHSKIVGGFSIAKAGTHLQAKTLNGITPKIKTTVRPPDLCNVIESTVNFAISKRDCFLSAHAIYTPESANLLKKNNIKVCFIQRDPRDQIVSTAFMVKNSKKQWPIHHRWSLDDIITELIVGGGAIWGSVFGASETWRSLKGIKEFYNLYLPWKNEPNVYTTSFEKLVGDKGGGSNDAQLKEIIAIARHIEEPMTQNRARYIARKLFGGTQTFRQGKIGSWKQHFKPHHIKLFEETVGGEFLEQMGYKR
jgi:hypothetical protein